MSKTRQKDFSGDSGEQTGYIVRVDKVEGNTFGNGP